MGEPAAILRFLDLPDVEDRPDQKQFWFSCPSCFEVRGRTSLYGTSKTSLQCHKCHEDFYLYVHNEYICVIEKKRHDAHVQYDRNSVDKLKSVPIICPVCKQEDDSYTNLTDHELYFVCQKCASHFTVLISNGWVCTKPTVVKSKK